MKAFSLGCNLIHEMVTALAVASGKKIALIGFSFLSISMKNSFPFQKLDHLYERARFDPRMIPLASGITTIGMFLSTYPVSNEKDKYTTSVPSVVAPGTIPEMHKCRSTCLATGMVFSISSSVFCPMVLVEAPVS